ncbi:hypothetical protein BVY04_04880 [bacterium M21]|nr:hypothetical protein BVY04_04880 [bacterium M21]
MLFLGVLLTSCLGSKTISRKPNVWLQPRYKPYVYVEDTGFWEANMGKTVSVKGVATRSKTGVRCLRSEKGYVYVDEPWPPNVRMKIISVTGTVTKRYDGHVLSREDRERLSKSPRRDVQRPNLYLDSELITGSPEGSEELREQRKRYILKDFTCTLIDD